MILNFSSRFADAVQSGSKKQTIRRLRKDGATPNVGETLHLYTGLMTKKARRLGRVPCASVKFVHMALRSGRFSVEVAGLPLDIPAMGALVRADGFDSVAEFGEFFKLQKGPFDGYMISWEKP